MRIVAAIAALFSIGCGTHQEMESNAQAFTFQQSEDRVTVLLDGEPYTAFHFGPRWDKPFLFPLRTASGMVISRGWPVEPRAGEEQDHVWHRGIWFGHGDINGQDFWREKDGVTGKLVLLSPPVTTTVDGKPALEIAMGLRTADEKLLGTVKQQYTFAWQDNDIVIDTKIDVIADKGQALRFGDTDDGGFGFRLAGEFRQDRGATLINSEGLSTTEKIWGKPARWIDYSARVEGKPAGLAVFDHPSNLRHPTTWHARGYSLAAANPFGLSSFTRDKSQDGGYTVPESGTLTFRYRVLIHEGEADAEKLNKVFEDFSRDRGKRS